MRNIVLNAALCLAALIPALLPAGAPAATLQVAQGLARIEGPQASRAAAAGARLREGETLEVTQEALLRLDDGALLALRPHTRLTLLRSAVRGRSVDAIDLKLDRGSVRVLTGAVGRADGALRIEAPTATIALRGPEADVDAGPGTHTQVVVIDGMARLDNAAGTVQVASGQAAQARPLGRPQAVALLAQASPGLLDEAQRQQHAARLARSRTLAASSEPARLARTAQGAAADASAAPSCGPGHPAVASFEEFTLAYEGGNLGLIEERLSHHLVGRQAVLEGVVQDATRLRQLRLHFKDTQYQCGPDLTVVNTTWEKRFLDGQSLTPTLLTGRMAVLMQREPDTWKFVAISGDNPFLGVRRPLSGAGGGALGALRFGPTVSLAGLGAAPSNLAVLLEVNDVDLVGRGSVPVQIVSSAGDVETLALPEIAPGRFALPQLAFALGGPVANDNVLQVVDGVRLTARYVDQTPGSPRATTLLTATAVTAGGGPAPVSDTTPDAFSFTPITGASAGAAVTSNTVTITGINAPASVTVTSGLASINSAPFTATPGSISNGQTLRLQTTASNTAGATVSATVNVGGVAATFSVTTASAAIDTTPDPFTFTPQTGVAPGALATSNLVTIAGINAPAAVTVSGGEVAVNGGAFSVAPGPISNGQTLQVRTTASGTFGATVSATVSVGGVAASFSVTTAAADTTPDPFSFTPVVGVAAGSNVSSNVVTIAGINAPAPVTVTNALASINGGAFTATPGSIANGQTLQLQVVAAAAPGATALGNVTVGGVAASFSVTTAAAGGPDTTPDAFSFTSATGSGLNVLVVSNEIVITGINAPAPVTLVNGEVSINGGAFGPAPATLTNGTAVRLRQTSATASFTSTVTTLTIGGVSGTFTSTTGDGDPDAFTYTAIAAAAPGAVVSSPGTWVPTGVGVSISTLSVSGGLYSAFGSCPTAFTAVGGRYCNGDQVQARTTASTTPGATVTALVRIGGTSAAFNVTTLDFAPDAFTFTPVTDAIVSSVHVSNTVTVTGLDPSQAHAIDIAGGEYAIDGGPFTALTSTISNGQTLRVRVTAPAVLNASATATVRIGWGLFGQPLQFVGYATTFTVSTPNAFMPVRGASPYAPVARPNVQIAPPLRAPIACSSAIGGKTSAAKDGCAATERAPRTTRRVQE